MTTYCNHCYGDFTKNWVNDYERTGFCTDCVTYNPAVRKMAQSTIARLAKKPKRDAQAKAMIEAFVAGGSHRVDITHAATLLTASELHGFICRCEWAIKHARAGYAVPRFGFGGKDTEDVLTMLNCVRVLKEALNAKQLAEENVALICTIFGQGAAA